MEILPQSSSPAPEKTPAFTVSYQNDAPSPSDSLTEKKPAFTSSYQAGTPEDSKPIPGPAAVLPEQEAAVKKWSDVLQANADISRVVHPVSDPEQTDTQKQTTAAQNLSDATEITPQQQERLNAFADEIGVSPDVATADPRQAEISALKVGLKLDRINTWNKATVDWMTDPFNARVGRDQVDNLNGLSATLQGTWDGPQQAMTEFRINQLYDKQSQGTELTGQEYGELIGLESKIADMPVTTNAYYNNSKNISSFFSTFGSLLTNAGPDAALITAAGTLTGAAAGAASGIELGPPGMIAGGLAGGARGFSMAKPVAAAVANFDVNLQQTRGAAYREFSQIKTLDGQLIDKDAARAAAMYVGIVGGGLGAGGMEAAMQAMGPAFKGWAVGTLKKSLVENPAFRTALFDWAKKYGTSVVTQGAVNGGIELSNIVGAELLKHSQEGKQFEHITLPDAGAKVFEAMKGGAANSAIPLLMMSGVANGPELFKLNKSMSERQQLEAMNNAAEKTQLTPATKVSFAQRALKVLGVQPTQGNVYVDADAFIAHYTGKGEDPATVAEKLGVGDQLKPGEQMVVPKEKYVGLLAGTQDGRALLPHTLLDPNSMSESDIKGVFDRIASEKSGANKQAQAKMTEQGNKEKSNLMVEQAVEDKMRKAGTGKSEAKAGSKYYGAFFSTLSDLTGTAAFDLYQKHGGDIGKSFDSSTYTGRASDRGNFDPNGNKITLFSAKDPSTFLHESAHRFLHILTDVASQENAPKELKDLHQSALSWLGSKDGNLTEAQQEKWAQAWEGYLQDGKAPKKDLAPVFKQYSKWLTKLYDKNNVAGGFENRGEVHNIFGKLLGASEAMTQEPIAADSAPIFKSAEEAGMTKKQYAEYLGSKTKAAEKAQGAIFQKAVERVAGKRLSEYRTIRKGVVTEVTSYVDRLPIFRLMHYLDTGEIRYVNEKTNQMMNIGDGERIGLRREDFELMYNSGAITKKELNSLKTTWLKRDGVPMDEAAAWFGYDNGGRMVEDLVKAHENTREETINSIVEQRMAEKYSDVLNPDNIREATKDALLNDEQFKGFKSEIDALDKLAGKSGESVDKIRTRAVEEVSGRRYSAAIPDAYNRSANKAAGEAQKFLLEKNYEKAAEAKRRQVENYIKYQEAKKQVAQADSEVAKLRDYSQNKSTRATVGLGGVDYLRRIDEILSRFGLGKESAASIEEKRMTLAEWSHTQANQLNAVVIPDSVLLADKTLNYKEASLGLIHDAYTAVESIANTAKLEKAAKDISTGNSREARTIQIVQSLLQNNKELKTARFVSSSNKGHDLSQMMKAGGASLRLLEMVCRQFDGDNAMGALSKLIFEPIAKSYNRSAVELSESMAHVDKLLSKYKTGELAKDIYVKEIGSKMARRDILYVALQMGNEGNKRAFYEGNFNEAETKGVLSHLTKADWDTVQGIWNHLESFRDRISEHNRRITGVDLPMVEASPVETEHGTYEGGYFPLAYERQFNDPATRLEEAGIDATPYGSGHGTVGTQYSYRQERVGSAGKMVKIRGWGTLDNHLRSLFVDLNMFEPVRDTYKLVNDPRVVAAMDKTMGPANRKLFNWWISETIGGNPRARTDFDPALRWMRSNSTMAQIGYKISTSLVQLLGYGNSLDELGAKYALKGLALANPADFGKMHDWVMEQSDLMRLRSRNIDRDLANVNERADKNSVLYGYEKNAYAMVGALDMMVALPTWLGGYHKGVEEMGLSHEDAVQYADKAVRTSQGHGLPYAQARVLTGGDIFKLMTMFQSYANVSYNRIVRHIDNVGRKGIPALPAATAGLLNVLVGPALLEQVMKRQLPTQENEPGDNAKKIAEIIALQAVGYVPYIGNLARSMITGQDVRLTPFEGTVKSMVSLAKNLQSDSGDKGVQEFKSAVDILSLFTKIPASQMAVTVDAMAKKSNGEDTHFLDYYIRPPKQQP